MDRLEAMTILLRVVEKGSFSAASRELRMPLATVSRKVKELETRLGNRLLVRTTRKVALTDTGATYVASARRILEEIDETERVAAGEFHTPRGEMILTAPVFFGRLHILPVVTEFLAAYPEISVRLLLSDRNLHLIDDRVDMGRASARCRTAAWWPRVSARCGRSCAPVQSYSLGTARPKCQRIWPRYLASTSISF